MRCPKNDVLPTAFSYARYSKGMENMAGFGRKNSLTLLSLAKVYFNSLRDENDEPVYTYDAEYMRYFLLQSIKRGAVEVSINIINPPIQTKLILFQKK